MQELLVSLACSLLGLLVCLCTVAVEMLCEKHDGVLGLVAHYLHHALRQLRQNRCCEKVLQLEEQLYKQLRNENILI